MKFEEIFNEPGLYIADSFAEGCAFQIDKDNAMCMVTYRSKDDLFPSRELFMVYKGLFAKDYKRVNNMSQLFEKKK